MQDRYTGDIGDYIKYALLRALAPRRKLGVAWYLFPDETGNGDGRHVDYLTKPEKWRHFDPPLFDALAEIVEKDDRRVSAVEASGILGNTGFASDLLNGKPLNVPARRQWRKQWFEQTQAALADCDLVFVDPDNGLCLDDRFSTAREKDWKRLPLSEALALAEGRTAIIYHHNTRLKGGHNLEIETWLKRLGDDAIALRWARYSARTFFILNPTGEMRLAISNFIQRWSPHVSFHSLHEDADGGEQICLPIASFKVIKRIIAGETVIQETSGLSIREWRDLMERIR